MDRGDEAPIACTLQPGDYKERLAWLVELAREGLLHVSREDLRLELKYAPSVAGRVREMVRKEHGACEWLEQCARPPRRPHRGTDIAERLIARFGGRVIDRTVDGPR